MEVQILVRSFLRSMQIQKAHLVTQFDPQSKSFCCFFLSNSNTTTPL